MQLDLKTQTQLFLGLYERELHEWFKRCSTVETAIDVGADEGFYTLFFLSKTPAKRVISFEPSAMSRQRLQENLTLNNLCQNTRLTIISAAVGATKSDNRTTLAEYLPLLSTPLLIKVDIEGGEVDLLQGSQELLPNKDIRWIIETHSQNAENECREILHQANYTTKIIPKAWWRFFLPELRPLKHNRWLVAWPKNYLRM